ncbi:hypothetical protein [Microcoleus sp. S13_C5]
MGWNSDSCGNLECKKDIRRLRVTLEVVGCKLLRGSARFR